MRFLGGRDFPCYTVLYSTVPTVHTLNLDFSRISSGTTPQITFVKSYFAYLTINPLKMPTFIYFHMDKLCTFNVGFFSHKNVTCVC